VENAKRTAGRVVRFRGKGVPHASFELWVVHSMLPRPDIAGGAGQNRPAVRCSSRGRERASEQNSGGPSSPSGAFSSYRGGGAPRH
jgi:hypothetical protein